ncbi:low specificity L-threonine aldolase [Nonomuraea sp. NPDC005501]|uniref:threonine aldolase family protein n=1 Tax=Nonomuraea sp. NPDC005501 TaxID=3156884 RepID=UPI0033A6609B
MTPRHDPSLKGFASDNYAGVHPEILQAIAEANGGHQISYGDDVYTEALGQVFRRHFGETARAWPVFNGTAANVVSLRSMLAPWEAVVCAETAHINTDEGGAPEVVAGIKLLTVPTPDGKLTPELIDRQAWGFGDVHRAQPRVVSISNTTELGTVYTPQEIAAICAHAHERGLLVHLDGSRLTNAAAALDVPMRALTTDAGVDVLSFGGTKIGMLYGEAVVVLDPEAARGVDYLRKTLMQLSSKMRFVSAQFEALLSGDLWLRNARQANAMGRRLDEAVRGLPGVRVPRPVEANAVFAILPRDVTERLQKRFRFYTWNEATGEVRWMCAFDTTEADVDAFAAALAEELGVGSGEEPGEEPGRG